ncbi:MAG: Xaa-Pro peptidase family protein [Candidatus Acidiferrales bacterium]
MDDLPAYRRAARGVGMFGNGEAGGAVVKARVKRRNRIWIAHVLACVLTVVAIAMLASGAAGRERESTSVYALRRQRLAAQLRAPVVLFGYTGHEEANPSYVFNQEENFYYLTGHNEEGAALVELPPDAKYKGGNVASDILFLPPRDPDQERWDGPRLGPGDPGVRESTGFADVEPIGKLREVLKQLKSTYPTMYTLLPSQEEDGYPHESDELAWLKDNVPGGDWKDARDAIGAMRQIKDTGELGLIQHAIDVSVDAHFEAMKMMRPGLWEYQVAARMVEIHSWGGCETEAYAPIVGSGFNSTVLHYNTLGRQIQDGDIVVLDVGGQYSGYAADITRTLPASGKFTPRQREIYEIVLGAQNAAFAAAKPGVRFTRGPGSLYQIAYDYINSHGKDREGRSLGRYFITGLGHHIGLDVHDAGDPSRTLEAGMTITIEPGIYIPEENLGVRIEDDVLITPTGAKFLTARLPRDPDEIEKIMAEGKAVRESAPAATANTVP